MPPKRSFLQSPNPVKSQMCEEEENVLPAIDVLDVQMATDRSVGIPGGAAAVVRPDILAPPSSLPEQAVDVNRTAAVDVKSEASAAFIASDPVSPPPLHAAACVPASPSTPRSRFLDGRTPLRVCCNLDLVRATAGSKLSLVGICIAVFPASANPDRRYIQMADSYGSTGLTIWNDNVSLFGPSTVGKLVTCQRLVITSHNGKRVLSMARDSTLSIDDDGQHAVVDWWQGLLKTRALSSLEAHAMEDNSIISVSGVVGQISEEAKVVNGKNRVLTTIHLVDSTGRFDVRTWNHVPSQFKLYVDKPVKIQRVRVTSFAGDKLAEFLDGQGSVILTSFPDHEAMSSWWHNSNA